MPLTGTYPRNLDEKHRLAIPKRLADDFGELDLRSFFLAPGTDHSITMYSPTGFERLARKVARQSSQRPDVRNYLRLFYARAERVELDAQSRIRVPDRLVSLAGLQRDVVLLGVHDHVEIWDSAAWTAFLAEKEPAFDDLATQAFSDGE